MPLFRAAAPILAACAIVQGQAAGGAPIALTGGAGAVTARLPEGDVKLLMERLPDRQASLLERVSTKDLLELAAAEEDGRISEAEVSEKLEDMIGLRAAFLIAASHPDAAERIAPGLRGTTGAEFVTAAYSAQPDESVVADRLGDSSVSEFVADMVALAPLIRRPWRPCSSGPVPDRPSDGCVNREAFRHVVGIGWRAPDGKLYFECSGVFVDPKTVLTAHHCLRTDSPAAGGAWVVLAHFSGGNETATRVADGKIFTGLRAYGVVRVERDDAIVRSGSGPWPYDLAAALLADDIGLAGALPRRGTGFRGNPVVMTAAGWGSTENTQPIEGIALEATIVAVPTQAQIVSQAPTLAAWSVGIADGGGVCHGDSGGPIFAGSPDRQGGANGFVLLGVVAAGNNDCDSGHQYVTDLTRDETKQFVCRLAPRARLCD